MRLPRGIYGITDTSYTVKSHVEAARAFLEGGVRIVQYRRKEGSIRVMLEEAREIRRLCNEYGAVFIVDDRVDIAILSDADGVHVGLDDAPVDAIRSRFGGLVIGASASTVEEAVQGKNAGANYIGAGSVFPSRLSAVGGFATGCFSTVSLEPLTVVARQRSPAVHSPTGLGTPGVQLRALELSL
jgi:thiamine-phosphate pyrophosphorylase